MEIKILEIRDRNTFIPAMATRMHTKIPEQSYLLARAGYSSSFPTIMVVDLAETKCSNDPFAWTKSRTMSVAHQIIERDWATLSDGDVIDVEFELKETAVKKRSEIHDPIPSKRKSRAK